MTHTFSSYQDAVNQLGLADTRLEMIRDLFRSCPSMQKLRCKLDVPTAAELLEIEDIRRCAAQAHVVRLTKQVSKLKDELEAAQQDELITKYLRSNDYYSWELAQAEVEAGWKPGRVRNTDRWVDPTYEPVRNPLQDRIDNY